MFMKYESPLNIEIKCKFMHGLEYYLEVVKMTSTFGGSPIMIKRDFRFIFLSLSSNVLILHITFSFWHACK